MSDALSNLTPTHLAAQIAPQRSTQYAALAEQLALPELLLSPLGPRLHDPAREEMGGQAYLVAAFTGDLSEAARRELGQLAMTSAFFRLYRELGGVVGPLLAPVEPAFQPALPRELVEARRYRGKTNELFTHFLCNIARFSSSYADQPWSTLRLLDPLAGGGTTLFTGLMLGADVAGVEQQEQDVHSTATFLRQFMREAHIACQVKEERLRKLGGRRWRFAIGRPDAQHCLLAQGDTAQTQELVDGFKPHLIVTDLPYGIQHKGKLETLLQASLPVWARLLPHGGVLAFSWDATRFPRAEMVDLVRGAAPLLVLDEPPYTELAHRVDRVVKQRDVLVARA